MNLYFNYQKIYEKTKAVNIKKEKYYLISKYLKNEIKKDYNYKGICQFLDENQILENTKYTNKKVLSIIKKIQREDILKKIFVGKNSLNEKYCNEIAEPNKITIKYYDQETIIMIYDNFELSTPSDGRYTQIINSV